MLDEQRFEDWLNLFADDGLLLDAALARATDPKLRLR